MNIDNPAVYECKGHKSKIHHWLRRDDGSAYCIKCDTEISKIHADEVWTDYDEKS